MVIALAGRRIDAPGASVPVFPFSAVEDVHARVRGLLKSERASALICSAACGADLIALQAAGELEIRRRIILPFDSVRFRETSVVDRPGNWGPVFDRAIAEVEAKGDLVNLNLPSESDESYFEANRALLDEAARLSRSSGDQVAASLIWNGVARAEGDITSAFGDAARARGWKVLEISTLGSDRS